ncbi:MAG: hypothetical protein QOK65_02815, partial [Nitrososphaeraceae archaeon]|nr:hypothetical protein [Nitrososphaeraceae archaeon]
MIICSLENPYKSHSYFSLLVAIVRKREILSVARMHFRTNNAYKRTWLSFTDRQYLKASHSR